MTPGEPKEFQETFDMLRRLAMRQSWPRMDRIRCVLARQWMLEREHFRRALEEIEGGPQGDTADVELKRIARKALSVIRHEVVPGATPRRL